MAKSLRNLSIGKKFLLSLCVLLVIPLLIIFLVIYQNVTQNIQERNIQINQEIFLQTKHPIHYLIQDIEFVSLEVLGNQHLQYYMQQRDKLSAKEQEQIKIDITYDLGKLSHSRDAIQSLAIFTEDEILFQFEGYVTQEPARTYREEASTRQGRPLWIPATNNRGYISQSDRGFEISLVRAINSTDRFNQVLGYQRISIPESYLATLYQGISSEDTDLLCIVDSTGRVVSSWQKELLGHTLDKEGAGMVTAGEALPLNLNLLQGQKGTITADNHVMYYYGFDETDWYMVKIDAIESVQGMGVMNAIMGLSLVLITLFAVTFYFLQRHYIIRPVALLQQDMAKIQDGQYHIAKHTKAKDEIGTLNQGLIDMSRRIQNLIERQYKMKIHETEAELQYLQSQINPHFLYNTLDSLRWMAVKEQQHNLAKQITALSNHFRHSLNQGKKMTTLGAEVEHLKDYLTIQQNRFSQLQANIHMDSELEHLPVLNLILQPLVENSIVHGLEQKIGDWHIGVSLHKVFNQRADREGWFLHGVVEDNGVGANEEAIRLALAGKNDTNNALALQNVQKRLVYTYGKAYGIEFYSTIGVGTRVELWIPITGQQHKEEM